MRRYAGGTGRAAQGMLFGIVIDPSIYSEALLIYMISRQAIWCHARTLACQVGPVSSWSFEKC